MSPRVYAEKAALRSCLSWVYFKRPSDQKHHLCLGPGRKAHKKSPGLPVKILLAHMRVFIFFLVQTVVWERQRNKVLGSVENSDKDFSSRHTQGQPHQLWQGSPLSPAPNDKAKVLIKGPLGGDKRWSSTSKSTHCWTGGRSLFSPLSPFNLSSCWLWRGF